MRSLKSAPVIIYRRGGGGGAEDFRGITWFLGEQKGGSVVTENPKEGITENFGRIQRGESLKFAWKIKTWGGWRKSSKVIRGDHFGEVTVKGGIG